MPHHRACLAAINAAVHVGTMLQQQHRGFRVADVARDHQQRVAFVVGEICRQAGDGLIE
jgi:hypothetical protein